MPSPGGGGAWGSADSCGRGVSPKLMALVVGVAACPEICATSQSEARVDRSWNAVRYGLSPARRRYVLATLGVWKWPGGCPGFRPAHCICDRISRYQQGMGISRRPPVRRAWLRLAMRGPPNQGRQPAVARVSSPVSGMHGCQREEGSRRRRLLHRPHAARCDDRPVQDIVSGAGAGRSRAKQRLWRTGAWVRTGHTRCRRRTVWARAGRECFRRKHPSDTR